MLKFELYFPPFLLITEGTKKILRKMIIRDVAQRYDISQLVTAFDELLTLPIVYPSKNTAEWTPEYFVNFIFGVSLILGRLKALLPIIEPLPGINPDKLKLLIRDTANLQKGYLSQLFKDLTLKKPMRNIEPAK